MTSLSGSFISNSNSIRYKKYHYEHNFIIENIQKEIKMYSNEETIWTNQQLYYFKDKSYNSKGSLELTISNTTKDYNYFSRTLSVLE